MLKHILMQCASLVARNAVTRKIIDGVEHVVISSMTLPDDIVMNGGLYPADEIEKSFNSLERTLAPVEHPTDSQGNFIPATDPSAIHNFYAGAFNENVRRDGDRIAIDKVINVQEALKTERGRRLLDRIEELETNEKARPIHTSVGVYVAVEKLDAPQRNAQNQEFTWIARNMVFDHDAILLDSVGAAQPHQGVGIAVNAEGDQVEVQHHLIANEPEDRETVPTYSGDSAPEGTDMSMSEIRDALDDALSRDPSASIADFRHIEDIFPDRVIYSVEGNLFEASYTIEDDGRATIVSLPLPVKREVTYLPRTNNNQGDAMKELMLNALKSAGVEVSADISDADLMAKYNEHMASQNSDGGGAPADGGTAANDATVAAVNAAIAPVLDRIGGLEAQMNKQSDDEVNELAEIIGNSDKFPGVDTEAAKVIPVETLRSMAANCKPAHGLPLNVNQGNGGAAPRHSYGMPGSQAAN